MMIRYRNKTPLATCKNEGYEPWAHAEALVDVWITEGYPFFAVGMNTVQLGATDNQKRVALEKYGSEENFFKTVCAEMRDARREMRQNVTICDKM